MNTPVDGRLLIEFNPVRDIKRMPTTTTKDLVWLNQNHTDRLLNTFNKDSKHQLRNYDSLISLKDDEVILSDSETDEYVSRGISNGKIFVITYSSKVEVEGENPNSEEEMEPCNF